jgi:hypothetical protein
MLRLSTKSFLKIRLDLINKSKKHLKATTEMILKYRILTKDYHLLKGSFKIHIKRLTRLS